MEDLSLFAAGLTAIVAGLLSFLSPCVLPLMPAYLSFVSGLSMSWSSIRLTPMDSPYCPLLRGY